MLQLISFCILSLFLCTACGNTDTTTETDAKTVLNASTTSSGGKSCLADLEGSLCDWLPVDVINTYFPAPGEKSGYKDTERGMLSSCGMSYEDPSQQVEIKVGKTKMTVPANYQVALLGPDRYEGPLSPLEAFQKAYRTPTAEEMENMRKAMQENLKKQLDEGKIDQEAYDLASSMKGLFMGGNGPSYEAVDGIGDAAVWGKVTPNGSTSSGSLFVLHKDVTINVDADAVESYEKSRELAVAVVREIIKLCD